jgi:hypothetical protein
MSGLFRFISILVLFAFSVTAKAELLQFSFYDSAGSERVMDSDTRYANPSGDIEFALSAGIDRRLRVGIFKPNGLLHEQATSGLLGANDRISANGKSYYGAKLSLSAPESGSYVIKAEMLTSDGEAVQEDVYPVVFDLAPPIFDDFTVHATNYGMTKGDTWELGRGANRGPYFLLSGVSDDQAIDGVKLEIAGEDGRIVYNKTVDYDATSNSARVYLRSGVFPSSNLDETFNASFFITDVSGNAVETKKKGEPPVLEVQDDA